MVSNDGPMYSSPWVLISSTFLAPENSSKVWFGFLSSYSKNEKYFIIAAESRILADYIPAYSVGVF